MPRTCVLGQDVFEAVQASRVANVVRTDRGFSSEQLCRWQESMGRRGYIEAEIVKSMYGFSLRYASGLHNFGLIASSRHRQVDGSWESVMEYAKRWQAQAPELRYVTTSEDNVP